MSAGCALIWMFHIRFEPALGRLARFANNIRVASFAGCLWAWLWAALSLANVFSTEWASTIGYWCVCSPPRESLPAQSECLSVGLPIVLIAAWMLNDRRSLRLMEKRMKKEEQILTVRRRLLASDTSVH